MPRSTQPNHSLQLFCAALLSIVLPFGVAGYLARRSADALSAANVSVAAIRGEPVAGARSEPQPRSQPEPQPPERAWRAVEGAQRFRVEQAQRYLLTERHEADVMTWLTMGLAPVWMVALLVIGRRHRVSERALRKNEAMLRVFIEHAPASLAMFDREMRYLAASKRWLADYGLGERDIIGVCHYDVIPETGPEWKRVHQRALAGELQQALSDRFVRADGTVQWLHWEARPWRDERGQVGGIMIFTEDISELTRALTEARELTEWLHLAQAAAGVGTWQWTLATDENIWSKGLWKLYGLPLESCAPSYAAWLGVVLEEDRERADRSVREAVERQADISLEFRVRWPDGSVHHLLSRGAVFRDAAGKPDKYLGIVIDMTESKRLEELARSSEQQELLRLLSAQLASAIENVQDAIALFDADGQLLLCNSAYARLIAGSAPDAILGRRHAELIEAWLERCVRSQGANGAAHTVLFEPSDVYRSVSVDVGTVDGRSLRVSARRTPDRGIVETIWDLTEDEHRAEELRQAHAAAQAGSEAKSEFLSSMSHELRTPLNAVLGFAQLLQRDKRAPLSPAQHERVEHILKAGGHLLRLIDDILDMSRIEAGRVSIASESVDVRDTLRDVLQTLGPLAAESGISVHAEPVPEDVPRVFADPTRFAQILINFGTNAIKYNRPGGRVTLRVRALPPEHLRVSVEDTGIGIPSAKQPLLFQPFQRIGQEAGPIEGTGIGLVITQRLASLMSAELGFESAEGQGSTFWVDVPVCIGAAPSPPPPPALLSS